MPHYLPMKRKSYDDDLVCKRYGCQRKRMNPENPFCCDACKDHQWDWNQKNWIHTKDCDEQYYRKYDDWNLQQEKIYHDKKRRKFEPKRFKPPKADFYEVGHTVNCDCMNVFDSNIAHFLRERICVEPSDLHPCWQENQESINYDIKASSTTRKVIIQACRMEHLRPSAWKDNAVLDVRDIAHTQTTLDLSGCRREVQSSFVEKQRLHAQVA